jgi:hypothetical protein
VAVLCIVVGFELGERILAGQHAHMPGIAIR